MSPKEYDQMVEKLAGEILEDCFTKEAEYSKADKAARKANMDRYTEKLGRKPKIKKGLQYDPSGAQLKQRMSVAGAGAKAKGAAIGEKINGSLHDLKGEALYGKHALNKHPLLYGTLAGAGIAAGTAAGIHAAKKLKAKKEKEQAQEKAAAYYEEALLIKEAAENVFAYADNFDSDYERELMKTAATEAYLDAEAQEEAAINVYNDIEEAFAEDDEA